MLLRPFVRVVTGCAATALVLGSVPAWAATAPTKAGAPKASSLVSVKSKRLANTVVKAGHTTTFTVLGVDGIPKSGVGAVLVKLTASKPGATGDLVAYSTGAKRPGVLSVSFTKGHDATSYVVVAPGSKGRVTTANLSKGSVRVIPTVVGWYRKATNTSADLTYLKPVTGRKAGQPAVKAKGAAAVVVTGHGVPTKGTTGVVLEVTAVTPAASGVLRVGPYHGTASHVTALSFRAHHSSTGLVTVAAGSAGKVLITSTAKKAIRVRVDVVGYLVPIAPKGGAPTGVAVTPHAGGATLTWNAAKTDPGYPVRHYAVVATETAPVSAKRTFDTAGAATSLDVTGLSAGATYSFHVVAVTKQGPSAPSAETGKLTLATPAAPTGVTVTPGASGSVTVSWTPGADLGPAVTGYTITGAHSGPVTVGPTVHSYTFTGQTVGQAFSATVKATNVIGSSGASAPSVTVLVPGGPGSNTSTAVSVDTAGAYHGSDATGLADTSADGSYAVFSHPSALDGTDANGVADVFLRHAGVTKVISVPQGTTTTLNGTSTDPRITPDGHWVVFDSTAALVPADTNGRADVYLYDTTNGNLSLVSLDTTGTAAGDKDSTHPVISDDGRYVAFLSKATNLTAVANPVHSIFVRDLTTGNTTMVSHVAGGTAALSGDIAAGPSISGNGNLIGYAYSGADAVAGDSNGVADGFVYNQTTGTTVRVSTDSAGAQGNAGSGVPQLSGNGQFAVFQSDASNLVAGDTNSKPDIFEKNLATGAVVRVSTADDGSQANGGSTAAFVSADGNRVLFTSSASNLVSGDTNAAPDAFLHIVSTGETIRVSLGVGAAQLPSGATASALSGNGLVALFTSVDPIAGASSATDTQGKADLFARNLG